MNPAPHVGAQRHMHCPADGTNLSDRGAVREMKSNDKIPRDEILLAEAIAAARARGLVANIGDYYFDADDNACKSNSPRLASCCAIGALALAGRAQIVRDCEVRTPRGFRAMSITHGNDRSVWDDGDDDRGETLGHAFWLATSTTDERMQEPF